jgi:hypothetical protein
MRRRELLILLGGAAVLYPLDGTTQAQGTHRLGIIMAAGKTPEYLAAVAGFKDALASLGWKDSDNLEHFHNESR